MLPLDAGKIAGARAQTEAVGGNNSFHTHSRPAFTRVGPGSSLTREHTQNGDIPDFFPSLTLRPGIG
jgi:hypothetical protein